MPYLLINAIFLFNHSCLQDSQAQGNYEHGETK